MVVFKALIRSELAKVRIAKVGLKNSMHRSIVSCEAYLYILNRVGVTRERDRSTDGQTLSWQMPRFTRLRGK